MSSSLLMMNSQLRGQNSPLPGGWQALDPPPGAGAALAIFARKKCRQRPKNCYDNVQNTPWLARLSQSKTENRLMTVGWVFRISAQKEPPWDSGCTASRRPAGLVLGSIQSTARRIPTFTGNAQH